MKPTDHSASAASKPPGSGAAKWDWHRRALLSLRDRLALDRNAQREEAGSSLYDDSHGVADNATNEFDHDLAYSLLSQEESALQEVDAALRRIDDGTYGVCEETGQPIPADRLKAIPWARYTKEVQERLEREGAVKLPHLAPPADVRGDR